MYLTIFGHFSVFMTSILTIFRRKQSLWRHLTTLRQQKCLKSQFWQL